MSGQSNSKEFSFQIKRIKDISFRVNEALFMPDPKKEIRIELNQSLDFDLGKELLRLSLFVAYKYPEHKTGDQPLVEIEVQNLFEVQGLKSFTSANSVQLPKELFVSLINLSISHTRALLASRLAGTIFQETMISILDPEEVTMHFYGSMLEETPQKADKAGASKKSTKSGKKPNS